MSNKNIRVAFNAVDFSFAIGKPVFRGLSLEFGAESPVAILGSSGCGKTTLLNLIAGLRRPDAGDVYACFDSVSMVFQEPRLLPWKTVLENVSLPLLRTFSKSAAAERAMEYLRMVSLAGKASVYPSRLSGGQKQRVNLARAFACPGDLLLMDEPFQSLDIPLRIELMDITRNLLEASANKNLLVIMVTHDPREAVYLGKRIIVLGNHTQGIVFDETATISPEDRAYGSAAQGLIEQRILDVMNSKQKK